jgi:hypothetical protein
MHDEEHPEFGFCKVRDGKDETPEKYAPQRYAAQGLAIIDIGRIVVVQMGAGLLHGSSIYFAFIPKSGTTIEDGVQLQEIGLVQQGGTYLIAAMRAYVASKFGEEVELP